MGGWELGNEPTCFPQTFGITLSGNQIGQSFLTLRGIINSNYPTQSRPKLVGPDNTQCGDYTTFFTQFLQTVNGAVDYITWHYYPEYQGDGKASDMVNPAYLNLIQSTMIFYTKATAQYAPKSELVMGETGSFWGGGLNNVSNTFSDGYWYIDELGQVAQQNHKLFFRQDLIGTGGAGGWYALLDPELNPNPDYFTLAIWKQVMGEKVLSVTYTGCVRAYAHCTKNTTNGAVTLAVLNLCNTTQTVTVNGLGSASYRYEYHLSAPYFQSTSIALNGVTLVVNAQAGLPSFIASKVSTSTPLTLQGTTYGFFVYDNAQVSVCNN